MTDSDAYSRYIKDISPYERISPEREVALSMIIQTCTNEEQREAAINELIHSNLRLVVHCQKEFERYRASSRISVMDLIAEGNIGLMKAAKNFNSKFDEADGNEAAAVRFSTYACKCIKSHMIRAIKNARFIHIPEHHFGYWSEMENLQREHGDMLSDSELQERMNLSEDALAFIKLSTHSSVCMLEDLAGAGSEETDGSWNDFIASENSVNPFEEACSSDMRSFLIRELNSLAPRTREIISMLYFSESAPTLRDISSMYGISSERCRQICVQGLNRLREQMFSRRMAIEPALCAQSCAA